MPTASRLPLAAAFAAGVIATLAVLSLRHPAAHAAAPPADGPKPDELSALRADVERLKQVMPDQSHAMADVGYHYANLWFAARARNWPLAEFYAGEVRSHLRWAVRIIPVRKDAAGHDVDVKSIYDAIETSSLKDVQDAVKAKDAARFETTYRTMLGSCISCHEASGKPFIRPHVPDAADAPILDFAPAAGAPR
jgi:cytochrome c553